MFYKIFCGAFIFIILSSFYNKPSMMGSDVIGSKKISTANDKDVVFNTGTKFRYTGIIPVLLSGELQMKYLRIYYVSGHVQEVPYTRLLKSGALNTTTPLSEPGDGISKIEFGYQKDVINIVKGKPHPLYRRLLISFYGYY